MIAFFNQANLESESILNHMHIPLASSFPVVIGQSVDIYEDAVVEVRHSLGAVGEYHELGNINCTFLFPSTT